ncbi:MAG: sigma-54-dependent Fis family transcriptional regulator [Nitrospiraceae bacterium]|nr:MAG: sigma-54-dependent Fis family transcriptional regulator [Nitrospiraceae bacterium]
MKSKGKIFLLDDEELIVSMLTRSLKKQGYEVMAETCAEGALEKIRSWSPDVVMLDVNIPDSNGLDILQEIKDREIETEVVMLTADDSAETAVRAMKLGATDYLTKPLNIEEVKIVIEKIFEKGQLKNEVDYLRKVYLDTFKKDLIGESRIIKELRDKAEKIALAGVSTVLITGESGTGKELMARFVHSLLYSDSTLRCAPFITINCTALPETLLESELFGYEKGAFTDARADKKGLFELANSGSILLDEIGDMKMGLQSKLLRVLEERTIRRIGGKKEIPIEVTVIATTNRELQDAVGKGEFRLDLFYRLNTFSLHILPLRERKEDILTLARHFLSHFTSEYKKSSPKGFSPEAEKILLSYTWPGNVRELKNVVERLVVLENTELVGPLQLPLETSRTTCQTTHRCVLPDEGVSLDELEKDLIMQALQRTGNNRSLAAKLLHISYDSLRYQIKKFGIE